MTSEPIHSINHHRGMETYTPHTNRTGTTLRRNPQHTKQVDSAGVAGRSRLAAALESSTGLALSGGLGQQAKGKGYGKEDGLYGSLVGRVIGFFFR